MSLFSSHEPKLDIAGPQSILERTPLAFAVLFHVLLWSLGAALLFGNLHADTLEAAYWGRRLAWGYSKHPPVATWLLEGALSTGLPKIFALLLLSQIGIAIAAFFVWRSVRLFASSQTAALAVLLLLLCPSSNFYAVQVNHNSMLAPFWAASMYFGIVYLEERRWIHAIALGVLAGVSMITKYEILFLLAPLVALAVAVPRYRPALTTPASYVCLLIFAAILAPHLWWLDANGWPSFERAVSNEKVTDLATLNASAVNALVGQFTLFVVPLVVLWASHARRAADEFTREPNVRVIASVIAFGPPVALLAGAIVTLQVIKPLWTLPLASSAAFGLALLGQAGSGGEGMSIRSIAKWLVVGSIAMFACFAAYLFVAGALGKPLAAYSADGSAISKTMQQFWSARQSGPLRCVVINERKIGPTGVLHLDSPADYVDFSSAAWSTPQQIGECRQTGAVALLADSTQVLENFPAACLASAQRVEVGAMPLMGKYRWPMILVYIPPEGASADCGEAAKPR